MVFFLSEKAFHSFSIGELQLKKKLDTGIRSEMTLNRSPKQHSYPARILEINRTDRVEVLFLLFFHF